MSALKYIFKSIMSIPCFIIFTVATKRWHCSVRIDCRRTPAIGVVNVCSIKRSRKSSKALLVSYQSCQRDRRTVFDEIGNVLESNHPRVIIFVPKHLHENVDETGVKKNGTACF